MLTLDATTASLEVVLSGAVTTNQLPIVASWADKTTSTFTPGKTTSATNNTSTVTIVAAPGASTQREVHSINIYNADTVNAVITVRENDNSTLRILVKVTLSVGDTLQFSHAEGWRVTDSNGNLKTVFAGAVLTTLVVSGSATVPTVAENDSSTNAATTAFVTANIPGTYGSRGNTSLNNSGTPNTKFDLIANVVILRNTNNHIVTQYAPSTITCDVGVAGSTANGRDQAGAFSASSWIYFYWIWNGATLASVASASAPTTGPTLPSGYTHWSYCAAVYFDGSSHLMRVRVRGCKVSYETGITISSTAIATSEQTVSLTSSIPPAALSTDITMTIIEDASGVGGVNNVIKVRTVSGSDFVYFYGQCGTLGVISYGSPMGDLPVINQQFFWLLNNNTNVAASLIDFIVTAYKIPNGGE